MSNNKLNKSRRKFLEFAGKSGIGANALRGSSLLAGLVANRYAQANNGVKRVVFVYTPLGAPNDLWLPEGDQLNLATEAFEGLQPVCHFHEADVVEGGFGLMWKALAAIRFNADWTGDTIDQQIAKVLGVATPFSSLPLGVQTGLLESVSRKNGQHVLPMEGPMQTYTRLFGAANGEPPPHVNALQNKHNVMDAHLHALNCSWSKLGSDELMAVEQYEAALSTLQSKLASSGEHLPACQRPDWNSNGYPLQPAEARGIFAHEAYLQAEIISHALSCGLTNVATLQLSSQQGDFLAHDIDFTGDLHQATCGSSDMGVYAQMINYLGGCIAYLIKQLAEQDDPAVPGTKLLDNTLVLQVSDQGHGPDHNGYRGPTLLATGIPAFKTGIATPRKSNDDVNLRVLQTVAAGLGLEEYIGKESHHCIWPCGEDWGGINSDLLT